MAMDEVYLHFETYLRLSDLLLKLRFVFGFKEVYRVSFYRFELKNPLIKHPQYTLLIF